MASVEVQQPEAKMASVPDESVIRMQVIDFVEVYCEVTVDERICVIGKTEQGKVVQVEVEKVPHELYIAVGEDFTPQKADIVARDLGVHLVKRPHRCMVNNCECRPESKGESTKYNGCTFEPCIKERKRIKDPVVQYEIVQRNGYNGYEEVTRPFMRIVLSHAFFATQVRYWAEDKSNQYLFGKVTEAHRGVYDPIPKPVDGFIARRNLASFDWFQFPKDSQRDSTGKRYLVDFDQFVPCPDPPKTNAPLVTMYLDIETIAKSYDSGNKRAEHPVGVICTKLSNGQQQKFVLAGGKNPRVKGAQVFAREFDMFQALHKYIMNVDPDVICGYNSNSFDFPYLLNRAAKLNMHQFKWMSRMPEYEMTYRDNKTCSNQNGTMFQTLISCPGRIFLDLFPGIRKTIKLNGYKLSDVAEFFDLGSKGAKDSTDDVLNKFRADMKQYRAKLDAVCHESPMIKKSLELIMGELAKVTDENLLKTLSSDAEILEAITEAFNAKLSEDVPYEKIYEYFHGTEETREFLVKYCTYDVTLCEILDKKKIGALRRLIARCKILRLRAKDALERGLGYSLSMMLRLQLKKQGYVNRPPRTSWDEKSKQRKHQLDPAFAEVDGYDTLWEMKEDNEKYPGAFVFKPDIGLHLRWILTFDFNSLYPSLIQRYNICRSTLLPKPGTHPDPNDENVSPVKYAFSKRKRGVLPEIERDLVKARKAVRTAMETTTDKDLFDAMDAEQAEIKVAANSLYGLLGTNTSDISNLAGAYSITAWGSDSIKMVCAEVEGKFPVKVVYGDTDSLLIEMNEVMTKEEAAAKGFEILNWVNKESGILTGEMKMGFEDLSERTLLLAKKKYIKLVHPPDPTDPTAMKKKWPALKKVGIVTRALNKFNTKLINLLLERAVMYNAGQSELQGIIRKMTEKLYLGKVVDINQLKHTCNLTKPLEDYDDETDHTVAAKQMMHDNLPVEAGDRISFFYCELSTKHKPPKRDYVVAAHLVHKYSLRWSIYVEELQKALERTVKELIHVSIPHLMDEVRYLKAPYTTMQRPPMKQLATNHSLFAFGVERKKDEAKTNVKKDYKARLISEGHFVEADVEAVPAKRQHLLGSGAPAPTRTTQKRSVSKKDRIKTTKRENLSIEKWTQKKKRVKLGPLYAEEEEEEEAPPPPSSSSSASLRPPPPSYEEEEEPDEDEEYAAMQAEMEYAENERKMAAFNEAEEDEAQYPDQDDQEEAELQAYLSEMAASGEVAENPNEGI